MMQLKSNGLNLKPDNFNQTPPFGFVRTIQTCINCHKIIEPEIKLVKLSCALIHSTVKCNKCLGHREVSFLLS